MTFALFSAKYKYHKVDDADLIAKLKSYSFGFEDHHVSPEYMIVDLFGNVEINSLEDLQSLQKGFYDDPLIIDFSQQIIKIHNGHIQ